jgi:2,3,4,5-tetrahydropyridine-2-carboxylate N-succinyltransferase
MSHAELAKTIDDAFERRDGIGPATTGGAVRQAVETALDLLDRGQARVAERSGNGAWRVNQWLKKVVLLSFRLNDLAVIPGGPGQAVRWDKVASKFDGWDEARFRAAGSYSTDLPRAPGGSLGCGGRTSGSPLTADAPLRCREPALGAITRH